MTIATAAILLLALGLSDQSAGEPTGAAEPPPSAVPRKEYVPAFPDAFEPYFDCKLRGVQRQPFGDTGLEMVFYESLSNESCSEELDASMNNLEMALSKSGYEPGDTNTSKVVKEIRSSVKDLPVKGKFISQETSSMFGQNIPPNSGMHEYYLCKLIKSGANVVNNGQPVKLRFPDDPGCQQALQFSLDRGNNLLSREGMSADERKRILDAYVADIDRRTGGAGSSNDRP